MAAGHQILEIGLEALEECIHGVISVRTSAYEKWNGPKSAQEQQQEAVSWLRKASDWRDPGIFLASKNNEIVGYLLGYRGDKGDFRIWHIGVREEFKRRGIGRALMRTCEEACRSRGYRVLSVTTYNRFRGMLILLLQEGFYIEGVTWITGASELRLLLRKELV